jgi:hydroxymethylpyrimidine pyrophosphatase-like HAD family hydrolase
MRDAGLTAKVSSIHVNGWFGRYDKLTTARLLFRERFGIDLEQANRTVVYAGDSPNDAPMFAFFANSVGVANVQRFSGLLEAPPKYVTAKESGAGFAELAERLLEGR